MPAYLTLSVGRRAQEARPVFSTDDPRLVGAVMRELFNRVNVGSLLEGDLDTPHVASDTDEEGGRDEPGASALFVTGRGG